MLISCSAALIVDSVLDGLVEHPVHHRLLHDPLSEPPLALCGQLRVQQLAGGRHRGLRAWARAVRVAPAAVSVLFFKYKRVGNLSLCEVDGSLVVCPAVNLGPGLSRPQ